MPHNNFDHKSIRERQEAAQKQMAERANDLRKAIEILCRQKEGEIVFRYLFLLSGGDSQLVTKDNEGRVDVNQTLIRQARKDFYNEVRQFIGSEDLKQIERHFWEINEQESKKQ